MFYGDLFLIIALVAGVAVALVAFGLLGSAGRDRRERLRILEDALRDDRLDDETRQQLLRGLVRDRDRHGAGRTEQHRGGLGRLAFGIGWLTMVAGAGCCAINDRDSVEAGVFLLVIGFGLVTLPMALREYDRRGRPARSE